MVNVAALHDRIVPRAALLLLLCILLSPSAIAQPGAAAASLQARIDAAAPKSELLIANGVYREPIRINKELTLRGESRDGCRLEVTADAPAIWVLGKSVVKVENLTIRWQRETSEQSDPPPCALFLKDAKVLMSDCHVAALGNSSRSPAGLLATGFSDLQLARSRIDGFEYAIQFWGGAEGAVNDCWIMNPGHCGITVGQDATVSMERNIVVGSAFHGIRCTGGKLKVRDNLIMKNQNRGIYLGNRSAQGEVINNLILENGTGISAFAQSKVQIENNVIARSTFAGLDLRDTCPLQVTKNIFHDNQTGVILFADRGQQRGTFGKNSFWKNKQDTKDLASPGQSLQVDPSFVDADKGNYVVGSTALNQAEQGLSEPEPLQKLWGQWLEAAR